MPLGKGAGLLFPGVPYLPETPQARTKTMQAHARPFLQR